MTPSGLTVLEQLRLERDLFQRLLELEVYDGRQEEGLRAFLQALSDRLEARLASLEVYTSAEHGTRRLAVASLLMPGEVAPGQAVALRGLVALALSSRGVVQTVQAVQQGRDAGQAPLLCVGLQLRLAAVLYIEGAVGRGPFTTDEVALLERVARFLEPALERRLAVPPAPADPTAPYRQVLGLEALAGRSAVMARVFSEVRQLAGLDVPVLLVGARGTGKSLVAQALHANSHRATGPYVELEVSALTSPDEFLPRLVGLPEVPGVLRVVEGGTLHVSDVAALPFVTQELLLRLIQRRPYFAPGGPQVHPDVRLVLSSVDPLPVLRSQGRLLPALAESLAAVVRLPGLEERSEDIPFLVDALVTESARRLGLPRIRPSAQFCLECEGRAWPGHVRQLAQAVEAAFLRASREAARLLEKRHLDVYEGRPESWDEAVRRFQRELLRRELELCDGDPGRVAERLGISRSTVYKHLKEARRAEASATSDEPTEDRFR